MVIVLVIAFVLIVVMASEIARAVSPWKFAIVMIGEIVAIEAIYTKILNSCRRPGVSAIYDTLAPPRRDRFCIDISRKKGRISMGAL
ncbi:hypothetical protein [Paraburkholderia sp. J41]|uniref:hypothetical protein n=1 Tax=Paraburkholderia sp. J41 TaxID=2805433 RepID=UPI002AC358B6|nr:hypothetical protein [Paraburkholderia sp. J41]